MPASFRTSVQRDVARWSGSDRRVSVVRTVRLIAGQPGAQASFLVRLQMAFQRRGRKRLARIASILNLRLTGAEFVVGCRVAPGLVMRHPQGIVVGHGTVIGDDCTILHRVTLGERYGDGSGANHDYPTLGDRVVVGAGAAILGGISVGDDAVVGANAVVLRDVAPGDVVVGIPARSTRGRPQSDNLVDSLDRMSPPPADPS